MYLFGTRLNSSATSVLSPRQFHSLASKTDTKPSFRTVTEALGGRPREQQIRESTQKLLGGASWRRSHPVVSRIYAPDPRDLLDEVGRSGAQRHVEQAQADEGTLSSMGVLSTDLNVALNRAVDSIANTSCNMTHFTRARLHAEEHGDQRYIVLRSTAEQQSRAARAQELTATRRSEYAAPWLREFEDSKRLQGQEVSEPVVRNNLGEEDREGWGGANHVYFALEPKGGGEAGFKTNSNLGGAKLTVDMEHPWMQEALGDGVVLFVDPMMAYENLRLEAVDTPDGTPALCAPHNTMRGRQTATLADLAGHYLRTHGRTGFDGAMAAEEMGVFHSPAELKTVVAQRVKAQVLFLERCIADDIARLKDHNPKVVVWLERQRDALRALYGSTTPQALNQLMNRIGLRPQVLVPTMVPIPQQSEVMELKESAPAPRWKPSGFDEL